MPVSLDELLTKTSRTFALAIPLLPEPTRRSTCLAYLLFRIADTLEDAELWSRPARVTALDNFAALLGDPSEARSAEHARTWLAHPPTKNQSCLDLLRAMPEVLENVGRLDLATQKILLDHASRTARGMRTTVAGMDEAGGLRLGCLEELRAYCYAVAGIVGELLTELFVHDAPSLEAVRATLVENQVAFGEGLQLVNILKDESADAVDGRAYVPSTVARSEVLAIARADMDKARAYIAALERGGAPRGFVGFTTLSADLADATLDRLEKDGAGVKVPRATVLQMLARITDRIAATRP
ncbi:MAG: squalene/phytoene synthase family protein [Polyangiaceae bacterium]|jgi:farnesyl-diphosphate farnesyltransferase